MERQGVVTRAGTTERMLVVTSCTARKAVDHEQKLTLDDFMDHERKAAKEELLREYRVPAAKMYTGGQHLYVMDGVRRIRERFGPTAVSMKIISAGYGLVDENELICPYEATFKSLSRLQARSWARKLQLAESVRESLTTERLCFILLGDDYLTALDPPIRAWPGQRLVFLVKRASFGRVAGPGVTPVAAGLDQTSLGSGLAALKGKMFQRFAATLASEGSELVDTLQQDPSSATFMAAVERGHV